MQQTTIDSLLTALTTDPPSQGENRVIAGYTAYGSRLPLYQEISAGIRACTSCGLHATRTQAVPGVGKLDARIVIVGEAPGENEDLLGQPFVGRSGAARFCDSCARRPAVPRKVCPVCSRQYVGYRNKTACSRSFFVPRMLLK